MNLTKVIKQLNQIDQEVQQLDKKHLTSQTFLKKYKTSQPHHNSYEKFFYQNIKNQQPSESKTLLKTQKHRYYDDIQKDEIQDVKIFGYSTYETISFFKKQQSTCFNKTGGFARLRKQKIQNGKFNRDDNFEIIKDNFFDQSRSKSMQMTKSNITRRRGQKLSIKQMQRVATTENPLPASLKQQYFTEQFFNFKNESNVEFTSNNIRCGSRSATFYDNPVKQSQFAINNKPQSQQQPRSTFFKKSHQTDSNQRHLLFKQTITNFYNEPDLSEKNIFKPKKFHLDPKAIQKQKSKFKQRIDYHVENLVKRQENKQNESDIQLMINKSIVYESEPKLQKESLGTVFLRNHQVTFEGRTANAILQVNRFSVKAKWNKNEVIPIQTENQRELKQFQDQCCDNEEIALKTKIKDDIWLIKKNNRFLLEETILKNFKFYPQFQRQYGIEDALIENILENEQKIREKIDLDLKETISVSIVIIFCSTLKIISLDKVLINLTTKQIEYKSKRLNLIKFMTKLFENQLPNQFVHLIVLTSEDDKQGRSKNSSPTKILGNAKKLKQESRLLFETMIHNSEISFFEGREIQVKYFKYFLKRFMSFDHQMTKRSDIDSSVALILESEITIPVEFQVFCQEMKRKDPFNILSMMKLTSSFKRIEINLSKLLADANQTVMMIKKQLFEGYDWRGLSLKNGGADKKPRGYNLEHFYI